MKILKVIGWVLLIALIAIQFIPSNLNQEEVDPTTDFATVYNVPENVNNVLQTSCYDCHSNNTKYPWYNKIQPVAMYLDNHVEDGKKHFNFTEFASYSTKRQKKKLDEVADEVKGGEMPLSSYTLIHQDAKLSDADKKLVIDWANKLNSTL